MLETNFLKVVCPRPSAEDKRGEAEKPLSLMARAWNFIRRLSGDDAYERYLARHAQAHPGEAPLSRKEYFRREQDRKWSGVRRCC